MFIHNNPCFAQRHISKIEISFLVDSDAFIMRYRVYAFTKNSRTSVASILLKAQPIMGCKASHDEVLLLHTHDIY